VPSQRHCQHYHSPPVQGARSWHGLLRSNRGGGGVGAGCGCGPPAAGAPRGVVAVEAALAAAPKKACALLCDALFSAPGGFLPRDLQTAPRRKCCSWARPDAAGAPARARGAGAPGARQAPRRRCLLLHCHQQRQRPQSSAGHRKEQQYRHQQRHHHHHHHHRLNEHCCHRHQHRQLQQRREQHRHQHCRLNQHCRQQHWQPQQHHRQWHRQWLRFLRQARRRQ
jgi:hypothetical protein